MLIFFISIGLSANFAKLKEGGKSLFIFLLVVSGFIIIQNFVGISLATALGIDPFNWSNCWFYNSYRGHGTAGAWGSI